MPGLIVESPVFAQQLEHHHAAGTEQAVGAHNDQRHRQEKQQNDHQQVGGGGGDVISGAQSHQAEQGKQPVAFGLALPHLVGVEQVDGTGLPDLAQVKQVEAEKQDSHDHCRLPGAGQAEGKAEGDFKLHQPQQQHQRQLGEQRPHRHTGQDAPGTEGQHFQAQHHRHIALLHAEDVVQRQFPAPPPDDKAVGIGHDPDHQKTHDDAAQGEHLRHIDSAVHLVDALVVVQKPYQVAHGRTAGAGEEEGKLILPVFDQVLSGQPEIECQFSHGPHPRKVR